MTALATTVGTAAWPSAPALASTPDPTGAASPAGAKKADAKDVDPDEAKNKAAEQRARDEAARQQQINDAAAEEQERAQAAAEARASKVAAASQRVRASWEGHGRPERLILIRERSVDLVNNGRLSRQIPGAGTAQTLGTLDRLVPAEWLSIKDGTADLSATIVMTRGTSLTLGDAVRTVRLAGGESQSDAASIYTGRGRLTLRGVTVGSFDPATGQPLPIGPGRPFLVASGGRLEATDSTIHDLGTDPSRPAARPALTLGQASTGSVVRTSLLHNSTGLKLDRAVDVRLEEVAVRESGGDGLVLRGDRGTTLAGITADRNRGNGVLVTGPSSERPITGITASGNRLFGVALLGQSKVQVSNLATADNTVGGLRVSWSTDVTVSDVTATNDAIGVYTHVGSGQIALERATITGARRGLQIEKTTRGLLMSGSTIERSTIAGVSIGGHEIELRDVAVRDSPTGVRVERGATAVTTDRLALSGGQDGVVALTATKNIVVRGMATNGVERSAVRTASTGLQIIGGHLTGSRTGIDASAATSISDVTIVDVEEGIRARSPEPITVNGAVVAAGSVGINVADGSPTSLARSQVDALESVRGEIREDGANKLSLPPLKLLGVIGVPLILLALVLEQVRAVRQRSFGGSARRLPPTVTAGNV